MVDLSQAPVMGRFSGDNPLDWVIQTEKYFIFYDILSKHKLSWASFYLDGEALEWYRWLFRNKQLAGWDHFVDKLFIRFQSRKTHGNRLAFLRQFTTVDDSQTRAVTISSWSTIANSHSSQSWNARSDYNKVSSAHQVFGEKLNKTTDIVVDVKNATMLVKSGNAEMLANQAKKEIFHLILDETKEEADFPVPQHFNEPLIYDNNQAHKVFDEFSVASKDVILESHKMLTINTDTIEESNYVTGVGNENKNEKEELFAIGNKIRQLVPAFVGIPPLWFDSPFSIFGDFAMFSMLHKLGIARCSEELCGMFSTCRYDQLTNRGTDASEQFGSSLEIHLALHHTSLVQHIWIKQWNALFEHIHPDCHDYQTNMEKSFNVSLFFKTISWKVDASTGYIDCTQLENYATLFRSKFIVTNTSAYAHCYDYACLRKT